MSAAELPMFPLQSVLVPAAPLPLHVFEPRYRALARAVLASEAREFGVVLIERGSEVGGGDLRADLGTVARVVDAHEAPDGRFALVAVGTRRLDVLEWLPDDPYPRAVVSDRPEGPWTAEASRLLGDTEPRVRRALALLAELGDPAPPATVELDPVAVSRSWQLLAVAPIATIDRHRLLGIDDPSGRLRALGDLVDEELEVLDHRLRGG